MQVVWCIKLTQNVPVDFTMGTDASFYVFDSQQGKLQKHQAFEAEVFAHSNAIEQLDEAGNSMIQEQHFASDVIEVGWIWVWAEPYNCRYILKQQ